MMRNQNVHYIPVYEEQFPEAELEQCLKCCRGDIQIECPYYVHWIVGECRIYKENKGLIKYFLEDIFKKLREK